MKNTTKHTPVSWLQQKLQQPLLGLEAQKLMAPETRKFKPETDRGLISSAVLLLFYRDASGVWRFPIIRRPNYNGAHGGQMALPGGKYEPEDENLTHTALREAQEEIGVNPGELKVLGSLSELYIPVTNITVQPVLAYASSHPQFELDSYEVDEMFDISLNEFLNPEVKKREHWTYKGVHMEVPFYLLKNQKVWGATAMILSELEQLFVGYKMA